jgi:FixJ family two-component response regulator
MENSGVEAPLGGGHIHVIDGDFRRRAQISRELLTRNRHPEVYQDSSEFLARLPRKGAVLMKETGGDDLGTLLGAMRNRGSFFPVAIYSATPSPDRVVRALHAGAIDYLQWPFDPILFETSLKRLVEEGERRGKVERRRATAKSLTDTLTAREHDVLMLLAQGNANKEIARVLDLSPRTVEIYRKKMMYKLKAKTAADAIRIAIYSDLLKDFLASAVAEPA